MKSVDDVISRIGRAFPFAYRAGASDTIINRLNVMVAALLHRCVMWKECLLSEDEPISRAVRKARKRVIEFCATSLSRKMPASDTLLPILEDCLLSEADPSDVILSRKEAMR